MLVFPKSVIGSIEDAMLESQQLGACSWVRSPGTIWEKRSPTPTLGKRISRTSRLPSGFWRPIRSNGFEAPLVPLEEIPFLCPKVATASKNIQKFCNYIGGLIKALISGKSYCRYSFAEQHPISYIVSKRL